MNLLTFSIKRFLLLSIILNLPPILATTKIGLLFLPLLFWVNIPVLWTGIAKAMGSIHFKIKEFGALPQTVSAYAIIIIFWLLVAALITLITSKAKSE
jgi:hypothetical protein